jgi:hypothetical protein
MNPIGFSTGALAFSDVRRALRLLEDIPVEAIELSAIREGELIPLLNSLDSLDLGRFQYISLHAPSSFSPQAEASIFMALYNNRHRGWPIIIHPDTIRHFPDWRLLGDLVCIENMDKRKPIGRSVRELEALFTELPEASFCFDIGHARQIDSSMTEAYLILKKFGNRLRQVHVSEVNTSSKHDRLSFVGMLDFREVAHLIPAHVPLIIESIVEPAQILPEMRRVQEVFEGTNMSEPARNSC